VKNKSSYSDLSCIRRICPETLPVGSLLSYSR